MEKIAKLGASSFVLTTKYYSGHQIKEHEMDGACSTYGGEQNCVVFRHGNMKERGHLKDLGVDGKIILKFILKQDG
jgi:hypothetical protein